MIRLFCMGPEIPNTQCIKERGQTVPLWLFWEAWPEKFENPFIRYYHDRDENKVCTFALFNVM